MHHLTCVTIWRLSCHYDDFFGGPVLHHHLGMDDLLLGQDVMVVVVLIPSGMLTVKSTSLVLGSSKVVFFGLHVPKIHGKSLGNPWAVDFPRTIAAIPSGQLPWSDELQDCPAPGLPAADGWPLELLGCWVMAEIRMKYLTDILGMDPRCQWFWYMLVDHPPVTWFPMRELSIRFTWRSTNCPTASHRPPRPWTCTCTRRRSMDWMGKSTPENPWNIGCSCFLCSLRTNPGRKCGSSWWFGKFWTWLMPSGPSGQIRKRLRIVSKLGYQVLISIHRLVHSLRQWRIVLTSSTVRGSWTPALLATPGVPMLMESLGLRFLYGFRWAKNKPFLSTGESSCWCRE